MSETTLKPIGAFSWNELMTTDVDAAKVFYGDLFGWGMQKCEAGDMDYSMATLGDQEIAGLMAIPKEAASMPPSWGAYVTVADVDALLLRVTKLGGKVAVPPHDIPDVGCFAVIQDPQGAMLSFISYKK
ncbi:MAG: VOC family protein [Sulfuriferula multivorans]|uniref:VOC family protein n=1 Tax=Sulfuriferula multivorans TaxID=1559896 RepID=A0A7C9P9N5_9PROT|nr:VOC family protein [Sulfuriferula multivorans]